MARILCIEDSKDFQIYLGSLLKEHNLTFAASVSEAVRIVNGAKDHFELIILDVSLPDGNGIKILPQLKEALNPRFVPIIVLSADDDVLTKVAAFGVGADDYVNKPPNASELRARIESKLRTIQHFANEKNTHQFGNVTIDLNQMITQVHLQSGQVVTIDLTPYEFKILKLLISRPGQVYTREVIIDKVWGIDKFITPRTVDAHVSHLRKKLVDSTAEIETVLSTGYKVKLKS